MIYNASEAHLFRCSSVNFGCETYLLVPDSFSTLGVTTPSKGIDTLDQGGVHLKGTDVCHVKCQGVILNCTFVNENGNAISDCPPVDSLIDTKDRYAMYDYSYAGTSDKVVSRQARFRGTLYSQWEHYVYYQSLDWDRPAIVTPWQRAADWYLYYRKFTVYDKYDIMWTGWVGSSLNEIDNYPHKHYTGSNAYTLTQYHDIRTNRYYTTGDPVKPGGDQPSSDFSYLKKQFFLLNEQFDFIQPVCQSLRYDAPWYEYNQGPKASAFLNAVEAFPSMDSNSWANLFEIISLLRDLKKGKFAEAVDAPKKWYEWWLQYRYRYSTTKSDLASMQALRKNLTSFHDSFGQYRRNVYGIFRDGSTGITWRCEVQAVNRAASQIEQIYHGFDTLGFDVSWYNLWDLIPYSFVVDWIFPVGDMLSVWQRNDNLSTDYWDYESICYSATYQRGLNNDKFGLSATVYDRWYEVSPPNLDQYYWFTDRSKDPSTKTGLFRLIDGLSLLVAGRH